MTGTEADRKKATQVIRSAYAERETLTVVAAFEKHIAQAIAEAHQDGLEEGRGDMEYFEKKWRAEEGEKVRARFLAIADRIENLGVGPFDPIHKVYAEAIRRALEDGP